MNNALNIIKYTTNGSFRFYIPMFCTLQLCILCPKVFIACHLANKPTHIPKKNEKMTFKVGDKLNIGFQNTYQYQYKHSSNIYLYLNLQMVYIYLAMYISPGLKI